VSWGGQHDGGAVEPCRTPWCNAPIRHTDRAEAVAEDGSTTLTDGQGLCESCNHAKRAPGWQRPTRRSPDPGPGGTHTVETTTPTGYTYTTTAPLTDLRTTAYRQVADGVWTRVA
jgi:hypothetical protein